MEIINMYKIKLGKTNNGFPKIELKIISNINKNRVAFFQLVKLNKNLPEILGSQRLERMVSKNIFVDTVWDLQHPLFDSIYPFYCIHTKKMTDEPDWGIQNSNLKWLAHCYAVEIDPRTRLIIRKLVGISWGFYLDKGIIHIYPVKLLSENIWKQDLNYFNIVNIKPQLASIQYEFAKNKNFCKNKNKDQYIPMKKKEKEEMYLNQNNR